MSDWVQFQNPDHCPHRITIGDHTWNIDENRQTPLERYHQIVLPKSQWKNRVTLELGKTSNNMFGCFGGFGLGSTEMHSNRNQPIIKELKVYAQDNSPSKANPQEKGEERSEQIPEHKSRVLLTRHELLKFIKWVWDTVPKPLWIRCQELMKESYLVLKNGHPDLFPKWEDLLSESPSSVFNPLADDAMSHVDSKIPTEERKQPTNETDTVDDWGSRFEIGDYLSYLFVISKKLDFNIRKHVSKIHCDKMMKELHLEVLDKEHLTLVTANYLYRYIWPLNEVCLALLDFIL
ncbi:hypothetical protein RFI_12894 [Reticulomyxa filosa]|uniref:Uncharacterized protein n=1 Tax=Reticulomyxa filosa TaxID=46433 RepID=X6NES1_RETFI|nr:hypothetical protein RFI_12894 [Reticulomyxa filosa]|eukprot:ETO24264.1 hypothetical protein RFI_12894 [Reticulomyxa filosa]